MCVLADDKETIKMELDSNRNELINSVERAGVVLRCLTKLILAAVFYIRKRLGYD